MSSLQAGNNPHRYAVTTMKNSVMRMIFALVVLAVGLSFASATETRDFILKDLEGIARHPFEPADKIASVLIFFWQDCPISNGYAPEINRIAATRTNFVFYVVQVDPELSVAAAREHARKFDLRVPVLLDPQHRLVRFAKATVTPEVIVFRKSGDVLYRGRIDNLYVALGKKRRVVTEHDLLDALDAIAVGKPVKQTETKAVGCLIQ